MDLVKGVGIARDGGGAEKGDEIRSRDCNDVLCIVFFWLLLNCVIHAKSELKFQYIECLRY